MATYYWVGGETGTNNTSYTDGLGTLSGATGKNNYTWVRAFDWNNPANWRTRTGSIPYLYVYTKANRCPSVGDIAVFGTPDYMGGFTGSQLTAAKAPCLWGGATLSGITTTWKSGVSGGSDSVTTSSTGGAAASVILHCNGGRPGTQYPFSFVGLPNNFASAADGDQWVSPILDAEAKGFTLNPEIWGEESWESLVLQVAGISSGTSAGAQERLNQLRIRTKIVDTPYSSNYYTRFGATGPSSQNHGVVSLDLIKNMERFGASGAYYNTLNSYCNFEGSAQYRVKGYISYLRRIGPEFAADVAQTTPFYSPRSHLIVSGATVGKLITSGRIGSILLDETTNMAEAWVYPYTDYHFVQLNNKFNRSAVMADIYPGGSAGITSSPNILVTNPIYQDLSGVSNPGFNVYGVIIGSVNGETFSANNCQFGGIQSSTGGIPIKINFAGNVDITKMTTYDCNISAWRDGQIANNAMVNIGELNLLDRSVLDFSLVEAFDGWNFGSQVGTEIVGGIVFGDETCTIKGSNGVRLWNDQLVSIGNASSSSGSKRTGKIGTTNPIISIE